MANTSGERAEQITTVVYVCDGGTTNVVTDPQLVGLIKHGHITPLTAAVLQNRLTAAEDAINGGINALRERTDQIQNLCGILGLEAEEQLEPTVTRLAGVDKRLALNAPLRHLVADIVNSKIAILPEEITALRFLLRGERPTASTGIHGGLTSGYGTLDNNGFWSIPLPPIFVSIYERAIKAWQNADTLETKMREVLRWLKNDVISHDAKLSGYANRVKDVEAVLDKVERNKP